MSFHLKDGIFFERNSLGLVTLTIKESAHVDAPTLRTVPIPPHEWASVLASVSRDGETGESYQAALDFHHSKAAAR